MIPEVEGTRPWGPPRKRVPKCLKGPKNTYTIIKIAEKQSKRSKKGPFSLYIGSPWSHPGNGIYGARRGRSLPVPPPPPVSPAMGPKALHNPWLPDTVRSISLIICTSSTTPFCNWRWPIAKTDSTQEQNSAPHPAVGAERLADVRNSSAKFGFSSSFSITSTLCVKNGISSKQFGIHSKRFDKVPPTFEPM